MKMPGASRGFSLIEVIIGIGLTVIALAAMAQISAQLAKIHQRYVAQSRLETTLDNIVADARAVLRFDGPAARALQSGLVPTSFTVYQWEPDLAQARISCTSQHTIQNGNVLHIVCSDRLANSAHRDIDLDVSEPFPSSTVTAAPTAS